MLISYEKGFLFNRVPKTGGTSINAALSPYRNPQERKLYARIARRLPLLPTPYQFVAFDAHTHWCMLKAKRLLPPGTFQSLFKFAFVRHPLSWQHSIFRHILRHEHRADFAANFPEVYRHRSFADYVAWRIDSGAVPQMTQLIDEQGNFLLDYVGRFEHLQQDFHFICQVLKIAEPALDHLNQSQDREDVRVDSTIVNRIYDAYRVDYDAFGYDGDGVRAAWAVDKSAVYPQIAAVLARVGGEDFDPWRANV